MHTSVCTFSVTMQQSITLQVENLQFGFPLFLVCTRNRCYRLVCHRYFTCTVPILSELCVTSSVFLKLLLLRWYTVCYIPVEGYILWCPYILILRLLKSGVLLYLIVTFCCIPAALCSVGHEHDCTCSLQQNFWILFIHNPELQMNKLSCETIQYVFPQCILQQCHYDALLSFHWDTFILLPWQCGMWCPCWSTHIALLHHWNM